MASFTQPVPQAVTTTIPEQWVVLDGGSVGPSGWMWTTNPLNGKGPHGRNAFSGFWQVDTIYHTIDPMTAIMRGLVEPNEFKCSEGFKAWLNIIKGNS